MAVFQNLEEGLEMEHFRMNWKCWWIHPFGDQWFSMTFHLLHKTNNSPLSAALFLVCFWFCDGLRIGATDILTVKKYSGIGEAEIKFRVKSGSSLQPQAWTWLAISGLCFCQEFLYGNPSPWCEDIWKWDLGRVIRIWVHEYKSLESERIFRKEAT